MTCATIIASSPVSRTAKERTAPPALSPVELVQSLFDLTARDIFVRCAAALVLTPVTLPQAPDCRDRVANS